MRALIILTIAAFLPTFAQPIPKFEVASIHLSPNQPVLNMRTTSPNNLNVYSMTLREIIRMAYGLPSQLLSGGPAWIDTQRFDITAKGDAGVSAQMEKMPREQQEALYGEMLQGLLADRFKLRAHRETREFTVYNLLVAKEGSKLKPGVLEHDLPANVPQSRINLPGLGHLEGHNAPVARLARTLSSQAEIGGRLIYDKTGLDGQYDFSLQWTPDSTPGDLPGLFTALQEQLGLKLESAKAPVQVLIVDSVDMPSEN